MLAGEFRQKGGSLLLGARCPGETGPFGPYGSDGEPPHPESALFPELRSSAGPVAEGPSPDQQELIRNAGCGTEICE
ncbi:hypothetical protein GCM10010430_44760 [Kitasatospora cystarginea]|uniref:Uncharacterized protein n=1 Tax=Kitasatospora cystarginea TaxID=58350 RepID=A0ABP5RAM1_9ACTN